MTTQLLSSTVLESNSTAFGQLTTARPDTRSSTYYDEAVDNLYLQLKKAVSRNPCGIKM